MAKVKVLFIYPHGKGVRRLIGEVVDIAEGRGEDPCHVAGFRQNGKLLEAIQPAVTDATDPRFYDDCKVRIIIVEVPDITAAEAEADRLIGTPYGLITDCVSGLIHETTGRHVVLDDRGTANCSETWTRILRAGGLNVLPETPADCVTPLDLMLALEPLEVRDEAV